MDNILTEKYIEDMKKSYKEGAKDYDRIIKQMQDEKEENDK